MDRRVEILLADADVLIDYRDSDLSILRLVSRHIGKVKVLREVLAEAPGISDQDCGRLGIEVVRLETEFMLAANDLPRSLSATDRLCVVACQQHGWTLVSNDRTLRSYCRQHRIALRWGLVLMIDLVRCGALSEARALKTATRVHQANPAHITNAILDRFRARLKRP